MKHFKFTALLTMLTFFSCQQELQESIATPEQDGEHITITATSGETGTRTAIHEDGNIWWSPKDSINVFFGDCSLGKFVSLKGTEAQTTVFASERTFIAGSFVGASDKYWGVYPYNSETTSDGQSIVTNVPSSQNAVAGSYDPKAFPSVGCSASQMMAFYNVCGGVRFKVSTEGITSVTMRGNNGEALAGKVKIGFDDENHPTILEVLEAKTEVTLTCADGFQTGVWYYIVTLPGTLSSGVTFTMQTETKEAMKTINGSLTVKRSVFGSISSLDDNVEWTDAVISSHWTSLGTGTLNEYYITGDVFSAEIQQNDADPTLFRIIGPFGSNDTPTLKLLKPGDVVAGVEVTLENLVYFDDIYITYLSDYDADIYLCHPSGFKAGKDESTWIHSYVMDYQENGLPGRIQLAGFHYMYGIGGWNNSASDDGFYVDFPGYTPKDFTFSMNHEGVFYDLEGNPYAVANIAIESEESDIAYISAACVKAKSANKAFEALLAGEADAVTVKKGGTVKLPMDGESGVYVIVAVSFDENDEPQEYKSVSFEYYAPGSTNPWKSIGFCKYTDDIVAPLWDAEPVTYFVEVLANSEVPGMYRMVHPYGADYPYNNEGDYDTTVHYFEIDATDPAKVWFDKVDLGADWGFGTMYAISTYAYMLYYEDATEEDAAEFAGKLEDGKITFPVKGIVYADDDGAFNANPHGLFCLDLNNPLPERPGQKTASSLSRSSKAVGLSTVRKPHSSKIVLKCSNAEFETFSK